MSDDSEDVDAYREIKNNPSKYTFNFKGQLVQIKAPTFAQKKVVNPEISIESSNKKNV